MSRVLNQLPGVPALQRRDNMLSAAPQRLFST
jgi:hypothetical protein